MAVTQMPTGVIIAASRLLQQDAPTDDEVSWNPIFPATCVMWGQGQWDTQSQQIEKQRFAQMCDILVCKLPLEHVC
jgi:hypothetical protein